MTHYKTNNDKWLNDGVRPTPNASDSQWMGVHVAHTLIGSLWFAANRKAFRSPSEILPEIHRKSTLFCNDFEGDPKPYFHPGISSAPSQCLSIRPWRKMDCFLGRKTTGNLILTPCKCCLEFYESSPSHPSTVWAAHSEQAEKHGIHTDPDGPKGPRRGGFVDTHPMNVKYE